MIAIIDYDCGNIGSIKNMLRKLGFDAVITNSPTEIKGASHIILPGVGSFDYGMSKLAAYGLIETLEAKKEDGTPVLGICLGAQLMCESSEEGTKPGLGWIRASVKRLPTDVNGVRYTVPHMGWDIVEQTKESDLLMDLPKPVRFYFVHSYYISCSNSSDALTKNYYSCIYDSAFEKGNILGVQFHPEKSHRYGKQLLKNFIEHY